MNHLIRALFTLLAATLFTAVSAQTNGSYLKFDVKGKTYSFKEPELITYNKFEPGNENERAGNKHSFSVFYAPKSLYTLEIMIHTLPHTAPATGKIPFVETVFPGKEPCPAVYLLLTKQMGKEYEFYISKAANTGSFEITKVSGGWVEGKFELYMPNQFEEDDEVLHITNGSFRFKIDKEMKD